MMGPLTATTLEGTGKTADLGRARPRMKHLHPHTWHSAAAGPSPTPFLKVHTQHISRLRKLTARERKGLVRSDRPLLPIGLIRQALLVRQAVCLQGEVAANYVGTTRVSFITSPLCRKGLSCPLPSPTRVSASLPGSQGACFLQCTEPWHVSKCGKVPERGRGGKCSRSSQPRTAAARRGRSERQPVLRTAGASGTPHSAPGAPQCHASVVFQLLLSEAGAAGSHAPRTHFSPHAHFMHLPAPFPRFLCGESPSLPCRSPVPALRHRGFSRLLSALDPGSPRGEIGWGRGVPEIIQDTSPGSSRAFPAPGHRPHFQSQGLQCCSTRCSWLGWSLSSERQQLACHRPWTAEKLILGFPGCSSSLITLILPCSSLPTALDCKLQEGKVPCSPSLLARSFLDKVDSS
nr:uncharacterized protein LOC129458831 [Symphalangus syndactylus]